MARRIDQRRLPTPAVGELVVRTGPDQGVSRTLIDPVTLIGSAEHCDLRILDFGVRPIHCAVTISPEGPHLRATGGTVSINGVPTSMRLLQSGDLLEIGPVQLEVRWPFPLSPLPGSKAIRPKNATASVPESSEHSSSTDPRRTAARKQNNLDQERLALRTDYARQLAELAEARRDAEGLRADLEAERRHLKQLRRRFIRKWKRHWANERLRLQRLEAQLLQKRNRSEAPEARPTVAGRPSPDLANERVLWEHERRKSILEVEIQGLEARIANLRQQLPAEPTYQTSIPATDTKTQVLSQAAGDILDLQGVTARQILMIGEIRDWTLKVVQELEGQAQQFLLAEEQILPGIRALDQQRQQLEELQTSLTGRERDLELRERRASRREAGLRRLLQRWSVQANGEIALLRQRLDDVLALRSQLQRSSTLDAEERTSLENLYGATCQALYELSRRERDLIAALQERDRREFLDREATGRAA